MVSASYNAQCIYLGSCVCKEQSTTNHLKMSSLRSYPAYFGFKGFFCIGRGRCLFLSFQSSYLDSKREFNQSIKGNQITKPIVTS
jgi:hypothetical protein